MPLLEIKAPSRYIEVRRPDGTLVSRHLTIEDAIESAANAPPGITYDVIPPRRTVKVYGSLPLPGGDTQAPTVPGNPALVSNGATTVTFSWAASTDNVGVDGYQVFRNGSPIATTSQTSYTDSGLTPSTQYTYTVAAYDAAGNNSGTTGQSPLVVTTNANAAPAWNVSTQALTTNTSYNLSLTDVCSDADSNPITFSFLSGTLPTGVTFNSVAKTVSGTPTAVGTQIVTFRATDGIVNSDQAITFEVLNADTTAPPVPTMGSITNIGSSTMTCAWGAVTDTAVADARTSGNVVYTLQRATDSGFTLGVVTEAVQAGLSANLTGLSASTQYWFRVKARDAAGNESAYSASVSASTVSGTNQVEPSVYPLELVSPRQAGTLPSGDSGTNAMPSGHRIFRAYPGIEYNIRAVVIGGSYPYAFSLSGAPSGMTINASTGEITWANPTADATPTITVTDSEGTQRSASWTITVSTSGFLFYSTTGSDSTGTGTLANPYQTLGHARNNTANSIVYFRSGTYSMANFPSISLVASVGSGNWGCGWGPGRGSSLQLLAYPGESVTFNHGYGVGEHPVGTTFTGVMLDFEPSAYSASSKPIYLDGIVFSNVSNCLIRVTANGSYHHVRRCTFTQIHTPAGGDNPSGIMWSIGTLRHYTALQDNTGFDLDNGQTCGMYKLYSHKKLLIEDDEAYECGAPFDIKYGCPRFEVRGGWYRDNVYQECGISGNQNGATGEFCSGEIRYNRVTSRSSSLGVNGGVAIGLNNFSNTEAVDIYRNTVVGKIQIEPAGVDSSGGPFRFRNNIIINDNSTHADRISYLNATNQALVQLGSGTTANLTGAIGSGIVNESSDLLLTPAYLQYRGSKGHQIT